MRLLCLAVVLAAAHTAAGQSELQKSLKDLDIAPHWIYDDLPKAVAEAKATGKPLFVVLRCVPCPPGKTLDGLVMKPDADLEALEKKFVCVRVVQTKGLDLKVFQYDYDQSWTAMFLNADMTIYGRYGTRTERGPTSDGWLSVPTLKKAMGKVLELHQNYPANKASLKGKMPSTADYARPEAIPSLQDRAGVETTRMNCIHCHMVREHIVRTKWKEKRLTKDDLFVYPMPTNFGLRMDVKDGLVVKAVDADSPAGKAGLAAGDELVSINGQPLISLADAQWVLHSSPSEATLAVAVKRGGQTLDKSVAVGGNWKESDISWRASSWYGLRQGLSVAALTPEEKKKHGLDAGDLGVAITGLFGVSATALPKAGLRKGDVIVAMDGKTKAMSESQFLVALRLDHGPDDSVKLTVLRDGARKDVTVPMW